jgi:hypothetical protein
MHFIQFNFTGWKRRTGSSDTLEGVVLVCSHNIFIFLIYSNTGKYKLDYYVIWSCSWTYRSLKSQMGFTVAWIILFLTDIKCLFLFHSTSLNSMSHINIVRFCTHFVVNKNWIHVCQKYLYLLECLYCLTIWKSTLSLHPTGLHVLNIFNFSSLYFIVSSMDWFNNYISSKNTFINFFTSLMAYLF